MSVPLSVAVVGAVNIDLCGRPDGAFVPGDSNPGSVSVALGGVGANIARNLRLLGCDVRFVTALGDDDYGRLAQARLEREGLDLSLALRVPETRTSTYLYITNATGDTVAAVSDMGIQSRLDPRFMEARLPALNRCDGVVIEANLPSESLEYLARHVTAPLFADGVSAAKVGRLRPILPRLAGLKLNRLEAERLTGLPLRADGDLPAVLTRLREHGPERFCITLGAEGALFASGRETWLEPPLPPQRIANTNGAGDALTAALVWSVLSGEEGKSVLDAGRAAAAVALESGQAVNPALSPEAIRQKLEFR